MRLVPLVLVTLLVSSRFCVPIPRTTGQVSFSDTFIFLTMLLYGGEVAVLLAAAELFATSRFGKRPFSMFTSLFNGAMMACSTFITVVVVRLFFGRVDALPHDEFSARFVAALCVMALTQYVSNTVIAAVHTSLKGNEPLWSTWRNKYLWISITYFGGASAAGISVKLASTAGFYALVAAAPIIAIVYLTYRTYLDRQPSRPSRHADTSRSFRTTSPSRSAYASSTRRLKNSPRSANSRRALRTTSTTRSQAYSVARNCSSR
ncbi:MAG: hypothetical protein DMF65_14015 [Acidobacteria bacterium]|nr:MAG: hypothetical protein DMF65_14015 [Acidobacteriota bacterium]